MRFEKLATDGAARRGRLQLARGLVETPAFMPVGTYVVATEPLGEERISALICENVAVADVNFVLDYFRRSADPRMLFGGPDS